MRASWVSSFSDGKAVCGFPTKKLSGINFKRYGFIDKTGKVVIEPQFDYAMNFQDGIACIAEVVDVGKKKIKYGFIDDKGNWIIKPVFDDVFRGWVLEHHECARFSEGVIAAAIKYGKHEKRWGYVNKSGEWIIKPKYYAAYNFNNGLAKVKFSDSEWGYIDKTGMFIWKSDALRRAEHVKIIGTLFGLSLIVIVLVLVRKYRKRRR